MKELIKWFLDAHLTKENIMVWRELFMNLITLIFVITYAYLEVHGAESASIVNLRMILLFVLGYYFNRNEKK